MMKAVTPLLPRACTNAMAAVASSTHQVCAISRQPSMTSRLRRSDSAKWRDWQRNAASPTAATCRSRIARFVPRWNLVWWTRAATKATGGCAGCTISCGKKGRRPNAQPDDTEGLQDALSSAQRMRQRAAVDVFQFATEGHALRNAG